MLIRSGGMGYVAHKKWWTDISARLSRTTWMFDYDGTLCPHREVHESRHEDPQHIVGLLKGLEGQGARVLWNTGRRPESLFSLSPLYREFSGYFIQGTQFWDCQRQETILIGRSVSSDLLAAIEELLGEYPLFHLEKKMSSLRLAMTQSQDVVGYGEIQNQLAVRLNAIFEMPRFAHLKGVWEWIVGHRGVELLQTDFGKGRAVIEDLTRNEGRDLYIALGDDHFDRPALCEAAQRGGWAIMIGSAIASDSKGQWIRLDDTHRLLIGIEEMLAGAT